MTKPMLTRHEIVTNFLMGLVQQKGVLGPVLESYLDGKTRFLPKRFFSHLPPAWRDMAVELAKETKSYLDHKASGMTVDEVLLEEGDDNATVPPPLPAGPAERGGAS